MATKKPLLIVKLDSADQFVKNMGDNNLVGKVKIAKAVKFEDAIKKVTIPEQPVGVKSKKKKTVKKVVKKKKKKVEPPVRQSPFEVGDKIWVYTNDKWVLTTVTLKRPPDSKKGEICWVYNTSDVTNGDITEERILPDKIFTLNANDAIMMKEAEFAEALNRTFDEKIFILAVYRKGQKRPWAYYIIPDRKLIWKEQKYIHKPYPYYEVDQIATIYAKPAANMTLHLMPISSAPQEILTYLGLHIYNRKWVRIHGADLKEAGA